MHNIEALSSEEEGDRGGGVVAQLLREAAARLSATSDTPRLDAELLMAEALGVTRSELLLRHMRNAVPEGFALLLERRMRDEPVAYILGRQEFHGLEFRVTPAVLIPRADSETLIEAALAACPQARRVLDFLGIPWDGNCLDFHRNERKVKTVSAAQVRRPVYRSSLSRWKRYEPHLDELRAALGDELGYWADA